MGTAHEGTSKFVTTGFPVHFTYNRVGPDFFFDTWTGQLVELTTRAHVKAHVPKSGGHTVARYED